MNLSELLLYKAQLEQIQSSTRLSNANAKLTEEETRGKEIENDNKQDVINADLVYKKALSLLTDKQREHVDYAIKQVIKGIELTDVQIKEVKASIANIELQGEIYNQQSVLFTWDHAKVVPISENTSETFTGSTEYQNFIKEHGFNVGAKVAVSGEVGSEASAGVKGIAQAGTKAKVGGSIGVDGGYDQSNRDESSFTSNANTVITLKNTDLLLLYPRLDDDRRGFVLESWIIRDGHTYQVKNGEDK